MELRVREVAKLLHVSEATVYRWVRQGLLPAHRAGEQLRFNRVELQEWAVTHGWRAAPELLAPSSAEATPSLLAAFERGGIHYGVAGANREDVLRAVADLPGVPAGVDRALLAQLLIGREALASTAVGEGIAIPHPRDPLVVGVEAPHVLVCFPARPVDFGALDGCPVRLLFVVLSASVRQHLQILARLSFALHDAELRARLDRRAPAPEILDRLRELESSGGPAGLAMGRS